MAMENKENQIMSDEDWRKFDAVQEKRYKEDYYRYSNIPNYR